MHRRTPARPRRALLLGGVALATLLAVPAPAHAAPFVVTDLGGGVTADQLAQSLVASGVTISDVTYTGAPESAGRFSGGSGIIGFDDGIVLGTGRVADLGTANTAPNFSYETGQPGDAELTALAGYPTLDATVLEFDVTPDSDTVFFNYVFASEEYNEYVGSQFNDVFAFTVTQPGGTAPANCAVVADGDPVSVNTINNGSADDGVGASNPDLFASNVDGALGAEPDGFTTTLQCQASVTAGQPNHLRLAIADASDTAFDSWVFIQMESLSTNPEVCDDAVDNDGDALVDADDPDCAGVAPVAPPAQPVVAQPDFTG